MNLPYNLGKFIVAHISPAPGIPLCLPGKYIIQWTTRLQAQHMRCINYDTVALVRGTAGHTTGMRLSLGHIPAPILQVSQ
jgi:hypothetical protein